MEAAKPAAKPASAGAKFSVTSGGTFWFTGLSGAGKSTLSTYLKEKLDGMIGDN